MKIAFIITSLANKGPILVVKDLVTVMNLHGHQCFVYYFDEIKEVDFHCPTQKIGFCSTIDFNSFDIVHSHGLRPDIYVFIHKPKNCQSRCISTLHNFVLQDLKAQYNSFVSYTFGHLWMRLLCRHEKIIVLSNVAKDYYARWFPLKKLNVVYNTRILDEKENLLPDEMMKLLHFKHDSFLLGVNALLTPRKGIDLILRSIPFIEKVKLWIVGNGKSYSALYNLAQELKIHDRVCFAGYKKNAYRYLPYYDCYIMSSRSEGFPLSLLEAAIYKKNIICSNIPIFKEIFNDNDVTFFEIENVDSLVDAIKKVMTVDKSESVHKRFGEDYSPEAFYLRHLSVYSSSNYFKS